MKRYFFIILLFLQGAAIAQSNSWIDYSKTYYKFEVGKEGLTRITQPVLNSIGLGNVPVEQFQLWHNGEEQILYTSVPSGIMGTGDYLGFYGVHNDGKPDTKLYRNADFQLSDHYSLQTDTSTYFLTVNPAGGNKRFVNSTNNVAANTLNSEPYFMRTTGDYPRAKINPGYSIPAGGVYIYSSAYDPGEGWTSWDIIPKREYSIAFSNIFLYSGGPNSTLKINATGSAFNGRNIQIRFNGTLVADEPMPYFEYIKKIIPNIPNSLYVPHKPAYVTLKNTSSVSTDRMLLSSAELTYPSQWNFGNQSNYYFELPATSSGNYLEIENFNYGSAAPVLLDLTSQKRYIGDITSTPGKIKFALPPSSAPVRKFRLVSLEATGITSITNLQTRNFINYAEASRQGDYLIISNPLLYTSSDGKNYVEEYRKYRSSAAGGGFKAIIVDINEITDQFAYGIPKHPSAIKDFIQYADQHFSPKPRYVFLIGKGVVYDEYALNDKSQFADRINLVPTFGNPGSDVLLSSPYGSVVPTVPIGRLSVVNGEEVGHYLQKMEEYESKQQSTDQTVDNKLWMKNVVQIVGGKDSSENQLFKKYMLGYGNILKDSLLGDHVELFSKTSNSAVQLISSKRIEQLFAEGIGLLCYFGHSSANTLEYNLSDPTAYNNPGKYPLFFVSGCTAGNNYVFDSLRILENRKTISENFVLSPQRGSIGFFASTHYGIPPYLNDYNIQFFDQVTKYNYGAPVGDNMKITIKNLGGDNPNLYFFSRCDLEEMAFHGDPALKINAEPKPDYVVEENLIKIAPVFISVSEENFSLKAKVYNMGKAVSDSIRFEIKRTYPNGSSELLYDQKIHAPYYEDSVALTVPIISTRDKGLNKITVTIDADNAVDELSETNNTFTKEFYVFEEEARPAYPENYAIVNAANQKLYASTADPLSSPKDYVFEIDTTKLFNSPSLVSETVHKPGGILEFSPGFTYSDSTVYYWRVAVKPASGNAADYHWNTSSFIYLANSSPGSNQSHYYQHLDSDTLDIRLDPANTWQFGTVTNTLEANNGVFPEAQSHGYETACYVNGSEFVKSQCGVSGIIISVINPISLKPWLNNFDSASGRFGSNPLCAPDRQANFQFNILDPVKRQAAFHFLKDSIPDNYIVMVRNASNSNPASNTYASDWMGDTSALGHGNSMYHELKSQGFALIDSFNRPRSFIFMYQKNNPDFNPDFILSDGVFDKIKLEHDFRSIDSVGYITSPTFGPALKWKEMHWDGYSVETNSPDNPSVQIIGVDNSGQETPLYTAGRNEKNVDISFIDATQYPRLKLKMRNIDSINVTPYQLKYWRLNYEAPPEGAIDPTLFFTSKDSLRQGEILEFGIAFKNISPIAFDSMKIKFQVIDHNNVTHNINLPRQKPLQVGDTIILKYNINTKDFPGINTLLVDFNPDHDQAERYHFNNFIYRNFYVKPDQINPLLDVTFDGVHILNRDIVSARPNILIKLKDESDYLLLNDTSVLKVQLRYPDGRLRRYYFNNDTLRFTPASTSDNTATIDFTPQFSGDGENYELIVSGKDILGNEAGKQAYHVSFRVITKPMISNMLNYPNPFTTSTAFVFTITGYEVPQNMRIQILTVTGKVIREITQSELGPLRIGRNITEFKWDGTDMYGQKVANGVYLYRVLTNLNGKGLDSFDEINEKIKIGDNRGKPGGYKFFIKGYGKMYLMR